MSPHPLPMPSADPRRRPRALAALLAVSWLPLLGLPLLATTEWPFRQSLLIGLAVFVGGVAHVASTAALYADADARRLMRSMPGRFVALPTAVLLLTLAAVAWGRLLPPGTDLVMGLFLVHLVWLYWHYQRQNWGLLSFAAAGSGQRLPRLALPVLMLPPLAGGLATIPPLLVDGLGRPLPTAVQPLLPGLHSLGSLVYGVAAVAMLALVLRHRSLFSQPWVALFAATSFGFFLPAMLVQQLDHAFWSYAIAHGLQYLLMLCLVSGGARRPGLALVALLLAALVGGWGLRRLAGHDALFVAGILLTWVHFLLDAKLWRLRESGPRQYLGQRLGWLLGR